MASNRIGRINEEIQKELASLIRNLKDPRVQDTMISITHVETTPDLRYAKVYASFLQDEKAAEALKGLKSASGYLRFLPPAATIFASYAAHSAARSSAFPLRMLMFSLGTFTWSKKFLAMNE